MKIFLDDVRGAYTDEWIVVKDYQEFVELMEANKEQVTHVSLDHDLAPEHYSGGYGAPYIPSGYDVVKWMVEKDIWPSDSVIVHSWNPEGAKRMMTMIRENKPQGVYLLRSIYTDPSKG